MHERSFPASNHEKYDYLTLENTKEIENEFVLY